MLKVLLRERLYVCMSSAIFFLALILIVLFNDQRAILEEGYKSHNFHRAAVLDVVDQRSEISGAQAADLIAAAPKPEEGVRAVLTRKSAEELLAIPGVVGVSAFSRSSWQLNMSAGRSVPIWLFNVPREFPQFFNFGATSVSPGVLTLSKTLATQLRLQNETATANISLPRADLDALPPQMKSSIDWSVARAPVSVSGHSYSVPSDSEMFRISAFTTGRNPQISIPGFYTIPSVQLIVIFNSSADFEKGIADLKNFAGSAKLNSDNGKLVVIPAVEYFSESINQSVYRKWLGSYVQFICLMIVFMLPLIVLARWPRFKEEILLREMLGAWKWTAVWLSVRSTFIAIFCGSIAYALAAVGATVQMKSVKISDLALGGASVLLGIALSAIVVSLLSSRLRPVSQHYE